MCRMKKNKRFTPHKFLSVTAAGFLLALFAIPSRAYALDFGFDIGIWFDELGISISIIIGSFGGACSGEETIGQAICNVIASATWVPGLITGVAYLAGLIFGIQGIFKLKDHVISPDRNPISDALKHFLAGGGLFALPIVTEAAYTAIVGSNHNLEGHSYSSGVYGTTGYGLDAVMVRFIQDIWYPFHDLLGGFAYLAGLIFTVIGIMRIVKSSQEGARGPAGFGTIMTFVTAGILFSLNEVMGVFSFSTFADTVTSSAPYLLYDDGLTAAEINHVEAVISAITAFVALVGWVSFIRGWFIIRGVAEGNNQASLMAGVTHVFGGALAVNLGPLLNYVQGSLGLGGFGVGFL